MLLRLLGADTQNLSSLFVISPGVEIINSSGSLSLGSTNEEILSKLGDFDSNKAITSRGSALINSADWNLSDFRFGPTGKKAPGILTLRAAGDIAFNNSLSDGFTPTALANGNSALWLAQLQDLNPNLPLNTQSWSYRISAGADFGSANVAAVSSGSGSVLVGEYYPAIPTITEGVADKSAIGAYGLTRESLRIFRTNNAQQTQ